MIKILALGLLVVPAMVSAQAGSPQRPDPVMVTDVDPQRSQRQPDSAPDPVNFCYYGGKAYSKGAVYEGQVCSSGMMTSFGAGNRPTSPLSWMPARTR